MKRIPHLALLAAVLGLSACSALKPSATDEVPSPGAKAPAEQPSQPSEKVPTARLITMQTPAVRAYRKIGARHIYNKYPQRISPVTPEQVSAVMNQYVDDRKMTIVVDAPADRVKDQLDKLGEVQVLPMPLKRPGMATPQPGGDELIRPRRPAAE